VTTPDDWKFRADYLRDAAKSARSKAEDLLKEAKEFEESAARCDQMAETPGYTQYTGYRP